MSAPEQRPPRSVTPDGASDVPHCDPLHFPLTPRELDACVRSALDEDGAFSDVTTVATVLASQRATGTIIARRSGVIAGVPLARSAFRLLDPDVDVCIERGDGTRVASGTSVMRVSGLARALLSAERVALNFLQRLSGIATLTARYVDAVRGTRASILDTRKTTPGWRALEKYAVRAGGGYNHRFGLADGVLIKDNHLVSVGGDVALAVRRSRDGAPPGLPVEVECDTAEQVRAGVEAGADIILLDNMGPLELAACVALVGGRALTEASGGVSLETVQAVARAGVDRISVGALTHSAPSLDIALDFQTVG